MKNKGQTTIELLLILVVSMVALSIIFSLYSEQVYQTNTQKDTFIAKNSVQKLVNAANNVYAAGAGSEIMVNIEIPSIVNLSETYISGNIISMKLYTGSIITAIADVNLNGAFASTSGKFVVYLVYDGNSVNFFYNDFELNQRNISFSTFPSSQYSDSIIVRNNSSQEIIFFIENNFFHSAITFDVDTESFVLGPSEIKIIDMNFNIGQSAYGNYSGNINIIGEINDANISKSVSISIESILEMEELMLYPYSTSFTTYGDEQIEKSFSICNKSLTDFSSLSWDFYGVSGDGNIISWIETLDEVTQITDVNSGECISFDLSFIVPLVDSGEYDANIVVNYTNSMSETDSYTSYLNVEILDRPIYSFSKSVLENNLNINYLSSNFVKENNDEIIPTGELDWNNLARNKILISNGDDYINTGVVPDTTSTKKTHVQIFGRFTRTNVNQYFGKWSETGGAKFAFGIASGKWLAAKGYSNPNIVPADTAVHLFDYNMDGLWVDNKLVVDLTGLSSTAVSSIPFYLFAVATTPVSNYAHFEMQYAKIFDDGVLIRHFVPNENGCLTDLVNSIEYCNEGVGDMGLSTVSNIGEEVLAYYKFNEASGTTIYDSARSYNGVLMNGATIDENGLWDSKALNLDGVDDYVNLGDVIDMGLSDLSVCAWIFNKGENDDYAGIVSKSYYGFEAGRWGLGVMNNNQLFGVIHDDLGVLSDISLGSVPTNEWSHVCLIFDRSNLASAYINNILTGTFDISLRQGDLNSSRYLLIGGYSSADVSNVRKFNGLIDEVKIYDRTLTEEEIILDYNNFLSAKFVDSNIVDAEEIVSWNSLKINSELNYNFGNEIESFSDLKEKGINELGSGSNADYLVDENLIGLWHLNDKNSEGWVLNSATNIRDGQLYNGADVSAIGLWDTNAGFFDGANDYLNINDDDSLEPTDITVSLWIYSKSWTHNSVATSLISKRSIATNGYFISYLTGSSSIQWDWCGPTQNRWNTGYNPPLNTWVNLVFVRNSSGRYLYVNGKLYNSTTVAGDSSNIPSTATLKIGNDNSGYPFDGFIEEVTIWNRPLDEEEVSELYDSQKADYADSLVGLWHLNDNAEDSSGNNNGFWSGSETYDTGLWETNSGNFNGSSFVSVSSSNFSSPISRTISAWINTTSTVSGGNTIMSRIQSVSPYAGFTLNVGRNTAGRLAYFSGSAWRESDSTNYNTGEWIHVVVVHDDTDITIYRNGVKDGTFTGVAISSFDTNFLIGKERDGALRLFNGKIEEVAIWNRALTAEEVFDLFETSSKKIDLEVYSCSDEMCENKTSNQEILNAKNNYDYNLTLTNSRFFGWNAYFKQVEGLEYINFNELQSPFIKNIEIVGMGQ